MNSILTDEAVEPISLLHTEIPAINLDGINMKRKRKKIILQQKGLCQLTTLFMLYIGKIPLILSAKDIKTDPRNLYYNLENGTFKYYHTSPVDITILNVQKYFYW